MPVCATYFDVRDLGEVLAHIHDAEIESAVQNRPNGPALCKELAGPTLAGLWRFLLCARLCGPRHVLPLLCALESCGAQHLLLICRLRAQVSPGPRHVLLWHLRGRPEMSERDARNSSMSLLLIVDSKRPLLGGRFYST
jgi:hypothetical protein